MTTIPYNAGIYSVKVTSEGNENYNSNSICILHNITKTNTEIKIQEKEYVYDGSKKDAKIIIETGIAPFITYYSDSTCTNITEPVNAGVYYGIAYFNESENYNASHSQCTKAVTINKANDNITLKPVSIIYTGNQVPANQALAASNSNIIYEYYEKVNCEENKIGIPTNAGTYSVKATSEGNNNYNSNSICVTHTISNKKDEISLNPVTAPYTGNKVHANEATTLSNSNVTYEYYNGTNCTGSKIDTPINVGIYSVKAESAGNQNYTSANICVTHTITKVDDEIKEIIQPKNNIYDGKEKQATVTSKSGVTPTITYYSDSTCTTSVTPKDAGKYYIIAKLYGNGNYNNSISNCTYAMTINKADDNISLTPKTTNYTGNQIHANEATGSHTEIYYQYYSDDKCKIKINEIPINAGVYSVKAISKGNKNYNVAESSCTSHIINKIDDTVKVEYKVTTYNKEFQGVNIIRQSNSPLTNVVYYSDSKCKNKKDPIDAGEYYVTGKTTENQNYNEITIPCTKAITINKANDVISLKEKNATYTGNQIVALPATTLSNTNVIYEYYNGTGCTGKKLETAPINIGTYSVKAISEGNNNYNSNAVCVSHIIKQAQSTITIKEKTYEYDGNPKEAEITSNTGVASKTYYRDNTCTISINGRPVEAGVYYVKATSNGNENYSATTSECTKAVTINHDAIILPLFDGTKSTTMDATILESQGKYALIDTFREGYCTDLVGNLLSKGITELEFIIITHFHGDHIGCLESILTTGAKNGIRVKKIIYKDPKVDPNTNKLPSNYNLFFYNDIRTNAKNDVYSNNNGSDVDRLYSEFKNYVATYQNQYGDLVEEKINKNTTDGIKLGNLNIVIYNGVYRVTDKNNKMCTITNYQDRTTSEKLSLATTQCTQNSESLVVGVYNDKHSALITGDMEDLVNYDSNKGKNGVTEQEKNIVAQLTYQPEGHPFYNIVNDFRNKVQNINPNGIDIYRASHHGIFANNILRFQLKDQDKQCYESIVDKNGTLNYAPYACPSFEQKNRAIYGKIYDKLNPQYTIISSSNVSNESNAAFIIDLINPSDANYDKIVWQFHLDDVNQTINIPTKTALGTPISGTVGYYSAFRNNKLAEIKHKVNLQKQEKERYIESYDFDFSKATIERKHPVNACNITNNIFSCRKLQ